MEMIGAAIECEFPHKCYDIKESDLQRATYLIAKARSPVDTARQTAR